LILWGLSSRGAKLTVHLHAVLRPRTVELYLYLHSIIYLHGALFNQFTKFRGKFTFLPSFYVSQKQDFANGVSELDCISREYRRCNMTTGRYNVFI
jgi:hypothetical protein